MNDRAMSRSTAELFTLLYNDGVDRDELRALVGSAFRDGYMYSLRQSGRESSETDE